MQEITRETAHVLAPPPLIYGGGLAAGLLIQRTFPIRLLPRSAAGPIGRTLIGLGIPLFVFAVAAMLRAGTSIRPDRPTTALVVSGPFRYSRNPGYLSMTLLYSGIAALANAFWPMALLP